MMYYDEQSNKEVYVYFDQGLSKSAHCVLRQDKN